MTTTLVPDFSSAQAIGSDRIIPGFLLALAIHIGLLILFLPVIEYSPPAAPMRIAVQVTQLQEIEPVEEEPEIVEPEPIPEPVELIKPPVIDKQILVAKDDTPPEPEELVVLEKAPEEEVVEEIKPVEPPPKPEPVKPEPKKVEKPKPKVEPKPEKPKVIEKPKQELPIAEPKVAEVIEPETDEPIDEEVAEISPLPSSTVSSENASSTSKAVNATGDNPNEDNRGGTDEVDRNEAWKGYG
ncbi:energy transducer TonB, partial [Methylophaga sp. UBA3191]